MTARLEWGLAMGHAIAARELSRAATMRRSALIAASATAPREFASSSALEAFVERFVASVLDGLGGELQSSVAPAYVHRAESYMRRNADRTILMIDVAKAAGCSLRALQHTFRRFRGTSPKAALGRIRLDYAHDSLVHGDEPVAVIARRYGFSHVGRFTSAYHRQFGETPSMTRRRNQR